MLRIVEFVPSWGLSYLPFGTPEFDQDGLGVTLLRDVQVDHR